MANGFYGGNTKEPWTFTEGRVCAHPECDEKLPDVTDHFGTFSPYCPPHRAKVAWKRQYQPTGRPPGRPRTRPIARTDATIAQQRHQAAQLWKDAMVETISAEGCSIAEVCERLQIRYRTYERQRDRDRAFAARIDHAKLLGRNVREGLGQDVAPPEPSFAQFSRQFFGRTHYPHQILIADTIENLGPLDVVLILLPPESGKTTTVEDWACRKIALDPSHRIRVVSEAQDLAVRIVGACKRKMTDTDAYAGYIARYGPFYEKGQERTASKPWTSNQFSVWRNPGAERDYNLVAQSWSGANYGSRIDTLVLDDLVSQRNVGESRKIFDRIRGTFFNRGKQMRTIIVGTRIRPGDFYDLLTDAGLVTRTIIIPALGGMGTEPGEPSTPAMWEELVRHDGGACSPPGFTHDCPKDNSYLTAKEYLALTRFRSGEDTWWASYMQNPRDDAVSTFGGALDDCKDDSRTVGPLHTGLPVLSIDPALGGGTALVAASLTSDRMEILDAYTVRGLARTEQQIDLIRQYAQKYRPGILIVEFDAQQKGLGNDDRLRALSRELGFTIVPHTTRGVKFDVPYNVASMNQSFVRREIGIPWGDDDSRHKMELLVHQLRGWRIPEPGKRDRQVQDLVMATWFIWRHWMHIRHVSSESYTAAKRPSWVHSDRNRRTALAGR